VLLGLLDRDSSLAQSSPEMQGVGYSAPSLWWSAKYKAVVSNVTWNTLPSEVERLDNFEHQKLTEKDKCYYAKLDMVLLWIR
jgi:hypothetical protein